MENDGDETTLGDIAEIVMGQSPKGDTCNSNNEGTPLLNGPTEFGGHHPSATQFTTDPKRLSIKDDLLFCVRGSTTGRMNWSDKEYAIGRGIASFRHKAGCEYKSYLKGLIEFNLPILLSSATGSTFPNVSKSQLNDLKISAPALSEQKVISHILGSLDDKIELNRQMNETLEAMAQALFKSWFVDFDPVIDNALLADNTIPNTLTERAEQRQMLLDSGRANTAHRDLFPSEFEFDEGLGWIPKGWTVGSLKSIAFVKGGYAFKGKDFTNTGSPVIKIKNINDDRTVDVEDVQYIPYEIAEKAKNFWLYTGDVVMAMTGAKVSKFGLIVNEDSEYVLLNQRVAKFEPKETVSEGIWFIYCFLNQQTTLDYIENVASGSAQPNISADSIMDSPLAVPSTDLIKLFNISAESTFRKMIVNRQSTKTLAKLRDTLLPKLMSGEVRLKDIEQH